MNIPDIVCPFPNGHNWHKTLAAPAASTQMCNVQLGPQPLGSQFLVRKQQGNDYGKQLTSLSARISPGHDCASRIYLLSSTL